LTGFWYNAASELMIASANMDHVVGRGPDQLTLAERARFAGKCIALEVYTPEALPLRRIEAIGDSIEDCIRMLQSRGLDPTKFEFSLLR
jgi:hypothetical protein